MKALNKYPLVLVHINHGIRKKSDIEQKFIVKLSKEFKIPLYIKNLDFSSIKKKMSIEEWGRVNRYKFLNEISTETGSEFIMTGHHGNDQVETILMNIQRGSGILGLRGIQTKNKNILRPLLKFSKKEIILFAKRVGYKFYIDESNIIYT